MLPCAGPAPTEPTAPTAPTVDWNEESSMVRLACTARRAMDDEVAPAPARTSTFLMFAFVVPLNVRAGRSAGPLMMLAFICWYLNSGSQVRPPKMDTPGLSGAPVLA